jgi:hypothetical protein
MSDWQEVVEEGVIFWVHQELGNVQKMPDGKYVALMPKIIKLGPFETIEQAQQTLSANKDSIDKLVENYNNSLLNLSEAVKVQ